MMMTNNSGIRIRKAVIFFLTVIFATIGRQTASGQDINYAKRLIDSLASPLMYGRGYVNDANRIASDFLASEMQKHSLKGFQGGYYQPFTLPINTFPGKVELSINDIQLVPGVDFIVSVSSPPVSGTYKVKALPPELFDKPGNLAKLMRRNFSETLLLIDKSNLAKEKLKLVDSLVWTNFLKSAGFILLSDKERLLWSVSQGYKQNTYPVFEVLKPSMPAKPKAADIVVEAVFIPEMEVRNVLAFIPGTAVPDSFLVVTAHYDHLGMMGTDAVFPGANDNASGVAMMLDLARHFSIPGNEPRYSVAFMALAAEETGLNGSDYYVDHPVFPLSQIAFLINIDMVGTGSEGITVVNGTIFKKQFEKLVKINAGNEYILTVKPRGESCNSDHCPFYKQGVPAVFIYSMGKEHREYHNIYDSRDRVPLTEYEDIFRLLRDFMVGY
ncbi:MAG: M28 family metallopeptidase [Lentimicrobium sp.]